MACKLQAYVLRRRRCGRSASGAGLLGSASGGGHVIPVTDGRKAGCYHPADDTWLRSSGFDRLAPTLGQSAYSAAATELVRRAARLAADRHSSIAVHRREKRIASDVHTLLCRSSSKRDVPTLGCMTLSSVNAKQALGERAGVATNSVGRRQRDHRGASDGATVQEFVFTEQRISGKPLSET